MSQQARKRSRRITLQSNNENSSTSKLTKRLRQNNNAYEKSNDGVLSNLCQRCASIDFDAIFTTDPGTVPSEGIPAFDLGWLTIGRSYLECQFCLMVVQILVENRASLRDADGATNCYLRVFTCLSVLGLARTKPRLALSPSLVIAVVPEVLSRDISISVRDASLAAGVILPIVQPYSNHYDDHQMVYTGRSTSIDSIDYQVLRGWIENCCSGHTVCIEAEQAVRSANNSRPAGQPKLLVIDCHTRVIVELPLDAPYATLSYVWGSSINKATIHPIKEGEKLPFPQPQTVEDALLVVQSIGQRYLWLDRYSIDQDDQVAKRKAILKMADVFENALLTIVSLASDVNTGLWGVSTAHRRSQPAAVVSELQLVSSGPVLEDVLTYSVWSRRGWTLQEALLSRRMLLFSEYQVYWMCSFTANREAVYQSNADNFSRKRNGQPFNPDIFTEANQHRKRFGEMPLPLYTRQVAEYTKRELSYSDDALHAFRAVLARSKERTFYGIPIFMTKEEVDTDACLNNTGFLLGLLWSRSAHQWYRPWQEFARTKASRPESRRQFPSWSWTSTCHCVQFDPISFDREASNKFGRIYACTYQHSPYTVAYADVEVPDYGSLSDAIERFFSKRTHDFVHEAEAGIESVFPSTLILTSLLVPWKIDEKLSTQMPTYKLTFQHPETFSINDKCDWFRCGTLFLDNGQDMNAVEKSDYTGTAVLLLHHRRYGYNWNNVVWWIAVQAEGHKWRRIGLIRSVNEVQKPIFPARDAGSPIKQEHRRPFLRLSHGAAHYEHQPPTRETLQDSYQTIELC